MTLSHLVTASLSRRRLLTSAAALALAPVIGRAQIDAATPDPTAPGSAMFRGNLARTCETPGPGPVGTPTLRCHFATTGSVSSSPVLAGGAVYVTADDELLALDAATGKERWHAPVAGHYYGSSPAIADGVAYVG